MLLHEKTVSGTLKFVGTHQPKNVVAKNEDPVVGDFEFQGQPTILRSHELANSIAFKHHEKVTKTASQDFHVE